MAWILALLAFAAILILAMYNPEWVAIKFLLWQTSLPLVVVVLGAAALGGVLVGAYALVRGFGWSRRHREASERIRSLELELTREREQTRHLEQELQNLRASGRPEAGQKPEGSLDG